MMRSLWTWLTGQRSRPTVAVHYNEKADPLVQGFRRQRIQAEREAHRATRRRQSLPIESDIFPDHRKKGHT